MVPSKGKKEFLSQLELVLNSVKKSLAQCRDKREKYQIDKQSYETRYQSLVSHQRKYFQAVKAFKKECDLNEKLLAHLSS